MSAMFPRLAFLACVTAASLTAASATAVQQASGGVTAVMRQPGTVTGTAWHSDNTPVSHAWLRLRDVATGRIVIRTQADAAGRFTFRPVPSGTYLVELVDESDRILGAGQMVAVEPGETVATFIRLGPQIPWYSGFFGNVAAAAVASAAALGLTAVGDGLQPASARF